MTKQAPDLSESRLRKRLAALPFPFKLLRDLIADTTIAIRYRGIDEGWSRFERSTVTSGFNPLRREIYVSVRSPLGQWCAYDMPRSALRKLNSENKLLSQVAFLLHDYVHAWSYGVMHDMVPARFGFMTRPIDAENRRVYEFCHLASEAAATVGVDYWWLCAEDIERQVGLGSTFRALTTGYRLEREPEYRRHFQDARHEFVVQDASFFGTLCRFYCDGEFRGFSADDLVRSPMLHDWLVHEVTYGEMQRKYTREWMRFLETSKFHGEKKDDGAAFRVREPWQRDLIDAVGTALWKKVRSDEYVPTLRYPIYEFPKVTALDLRFVNLRDDRELERALRDEKVVKEQSRLLMSQTIAHIDSERVPKDELDDLRKLIRNDLPRPLMRFVRDLPRVPMPERAESPHMFLLG